jgi:hypothetical protein
MSLLRIVRNLAVLAILALGGLSVTPGWAQVTCKAGQRQCLRTCCDSGQTCCAINLTRGLCCSNGCCHNFFGWHCC